MFLVLLEAVGKQSLIFETNKLRQNLGASQMVLEATTKLLVAAIANMDLQGPALTWAADRGLVEVASDGSGPIEGGADFEIIIATSGKAMLLCSSREVAEEIIWNVTSSCLVELPGVRVVGVIEEFDWGNAIGVASKRAHQRLDAIAANVDSPRFLGLPVNEPCSLSGTVAAQRQILDGDELPLSHTSIKKDSSHRAADARFVTLDNRISSRPQLFDDDRMSWIAVVHADGNGLGAVFADFDSALDGIEADPHSESRTSSRDRIWVDRFRELSQAVETVTRAAFKVGLNAVSDRTEAGKDGSPVSRKPAVPIVLAGDDMTVVCPGADAWDFTLAYLDAFASEAADHPLIRSLFPSGLTASAGVAIVKRHFPFSDAYALAESLAASAKKLKPSPGIDFHVLYDSSAASIEGLRRELVANGTRLYGGPYLLQGDDNSPTSSAQTLSQFAESLTERDDEGRYIISTAQTHRIRDTITRSRNAAEREWQALRDTVQRRSTPTSAKLPEELVVDEGEGARTLLLDAISLADVRSSGGTE